jgi:DNA mismatch repair protein MutL
MPIRVLDATVAAQIAAGEVVERPASVARELIENAIDAGARRVSVEVRGGGLRELRVQDDGQGIPADDVELAFARHATSKLSTADDLWSIGTLGFRGEALPSIASVSQVICTTRAGGEEIGVELRIAGGEVHSREPVGAPTGTSISVRNLFYNTPVRRDFLRSEASESGAVASMVMQYALAYPEVRFTLQIDGRVSLQTSGDGDLRAVLIEIYGLDIARQLLPVDLEQGDSVTKVSIRGLIAPPGLTRSTRAALHLFVNRRVVQPRGALAAVVEEAYHTLLMKGRHPLVVLNIGIHPSTADVNVHPTKSEVKFRDTPRVLSALGRAVRDALLASGAALWEGAEQETNDIAQRRFELRRIGAGPWEQQSWGEQPSGQLSGQAPSWAGDLHGSQGGLINGQPALEWAVPEGQGAPQLPTAAIPPLRILGQSGLCYIVADSSEGLYLIDQHAAHERILFERFQNHRAGGAIPSQPLLHPLTVELSAEAHELLLRHAEALAEWGFALEDFGMALRVRALPSGLVQDSQLSPRHLARQAQPTSAGTTSSSRPWRATRPCVQASR